MTAHFGTQRHHRGQTGSPERGPGQTVLSSRVHHQSSGTNKLGICQATNAQLVADKSDEDGGCCETDKPSSSSSSLLLLVLQLRPKHNRTPQLRLCVCVCLPRRDVALRQGFSERAKRMRQASCSKYRIPKRYNRSSASAALPSGCFSCKKP